MKTTLGVIFALLSLSASAQGPFGRSAVGGTFQQLAEITGTQGGDDFGASVAVSGNTLVVGAPLASNLGAAYVYTATNGDWTNLALAATLTPPAGQSGFGAPVAIDGDTIVVGDSSGAEQAVAYVFVNPSGNAAPTAELSTTVNNGGELNSIGIDGGTVVLGMSAANAAIRGQGAAFVYVEPSAGWANMTETAELVAKDGATGFFGWSVAISGRDIVVGATQVKVGGVEQGAAYLFEEPAAGWSGTWLPKTEFEASNGTKKAAIGTSVSVSGETVAVGAPGETVGSSQNEGAIYMFTRPSSGWPKTMTETAELTASTAKGGAELGFSLALSGKTLVAGAPLARANQGLVYLFSEPTGGWQSTSTAREIIASDGAANDDFGWSVAFSGVIAAGAPEFSGITKGNGAAYVFGTGSQ
jgi:FG-GAP repeat